MQEQRGLSVASRETRYAKEIARGTVVWSKTDANEGRLEHLYNKVRKQDEIRFSSWKGGRMMMRPLDLTEDELIDLLRDAIKQSVFSETFLSKLRRLLKSTPS